MDKKKRLISDAPESNAGDDFHVLWSIRKSLELLNTDDSALKAITVEGVLPEEAKNLDPTGFLFLGVDITEYFGGENFRNANSVIKYFFMLLRNSAELITFIVAIYFITPQFLFGSGPICNSKTPPLSSSFAGNRKESSFCPFSVAD